MLRQLPMIPLILASLSLIFLSSVLLAQPPQTKPFENQKTPIANKEDVEVLKKRMIGTWEYKQPIFGPFTPGAAQVVKGYVVHRMVIRENGTFTFTREMPARPKEEFTGEWKVSREIVGTIPKISADPILRGFHLALKGKGWKEEEFYLSAVDVSQGKKYDEKTLDMGLAIDTTLPDREHLPIGSGRYTKK